MSFYSSARWWVLLTILLFSPGHSEAATQLFNGAQIALFEDAPTDCLTAFNASLDCSDNVQLLGYDFQTLAWSVDDLAYMCTTSCAASLQSLASEISSACTSYTFDFNGGEMTAVQVVDLFYYKYNYSCLASTETGQFCLIEEQTWNITQLNNSGAATWPVYTNKTYPNWYLSEDGSPLLDWDESVIEDPFGDIPPFQYYETNMDPTGTNYFLEGASDDYSNYGWDAQLEYDEYPLELQCKSCFINQFIMGIESQWGEVYDEITAQIWSNMQQNCNLTQTLLPANNLTGGLNSDGPLTYTNTICNHNITVTSGNNTCNSLAVAFNVESSSIWKLNAVACNAIEAGTYCSAEPCQIAQIENRTSAGEFLSAETYSNITITQFASWNPFTNMDGFLPGDVVCVGPPGGSYVPATTTVAPASPSVFTTTAIPAAPTPAGTISNCGAYYLAQTGDYCSLITLNFSITMAQFLEMNPSLNSNCTNLLAGYDYCVALVNGTSITTAPTTTTTSTYVTAPTQTATGATADCYEWYTTKDGDSCSSIEVAYGITLAQLRAWNTNINSTCGNLWLGYAYCVSSDDPVPTTTTTSSSSSTYVPAPTQTVTGTTADCYAWYTVQSGDTCATLEQKYGITLDQIRSWNTYIDAACDNLWLNYAYCVSSNDPITVS